MCQNVPNCAIMCQNVPNCASFGAHFGTIVPSLAYLAQFGQFSNFGCLWSLFQRGKRHQQLLNFLPWQLGKLPGKFPTVAWMPLELDQSDCSMTSSHIIVWHWDWGLYFPTFACAERACVHACVMWSLCYEGFVCTPRTGENIKWNVSLDTTSFWESGLATWPVSV